MGNKRETSNGVKNLIKNHPGIIATIILTLMLVVSLYTSIADSNTMDEKAHIPSAYSYVKYFDMRLNPEHPPLIKDLSGLPLLFLGVNFPDEDWHWTEGANEQWVLGEKFIFESGNNADLVVFWSRFPIVLLSILLGWFVYFWTKKLAGSTAALIALFLYALSPNILGHNHLVTTDLGIAAFIVFAFYFFIEFLKNPSPKTVLLAGIFLALANLAKFSAVLLFPIFGFLLLVYAFVKHENNRENGTSKPRFGIIAKYVGLYVVVVAISIFAIWIYYIPHVANMPLEKINDLVDYSFGGDRAIDQATNQTLKSIAAVPVLKPLGQYSLGVAMVFLRVAGGNTTYFLGEVTKQSFKSYFPIIYLIKEPIPYLILLLAAFFWSSRGVVQKMFSGKGEFLRRNIKELGQYIRTHIAEFSALFFIVFYFSVSIVGNLNLGFRHLFPIIPLIYMLTAKTLIRFYKKEKDAYWKIAKRWALYALLIWIAIENIIAFPLYLSYFNQIVGGSENGYKYVVDSNTDWGQNVKRLKKWIGENNIKKIRVDYFGGTQPQYYLGSAMLPWSDSKDPEAGWYAISTTYLQSSRYQTFEDNRGYKWLIGRDPDYLIGNSIAIFNISQGEIDKLQQ